MIEGAVNAGLLQHAIQIIRTPGHEAVGELLKMDDYVDVLIPRGGKGLIKRIAEGTRIPVIKHYDGICHLYIAEDADPEQAVELAINSKCQSIQVCNALETLLVDKKCAEHLLPLLQAAFDANNIARTAEGGGTPSGQGTARATFAGGCFWCMEPPFEELPGVLSVTSGYTGGHKTDPTYEEVSAGTTGHAEAVEVLFDPAKVSYRELLEVFFTIHDPTTMNRQGADVGTQYRSAIFYHSPEQKAAAEAVMPELTAAALWNAPIVTELTPLAEFYPAEDYHQDYFRRNPSQALLSGRCRTQGREGASEVLAFGVQHQVDYVAMSFVRRAGDVLEAKELIRSMGETIPVVAKIEKPEAVDNLESILAATDGVMVARGDLGVELGTEDVPIVQKRIIAMANAAGKVVITATQMLESMIENPRPTRAEASDVANASVDGTEAVMPSGETVGKHPVRTVETMVRIADYTEEHGMASIRPRRAGTRVGEPARMEDLDLSHPEVAAKLDERFGDDVPLRETVISPAASMPVRSLSAW